MKRPRPLFNALSLLMIGLAILRCERLVPDSKLPEVECSQNVGATWKCPRVTYFYYTVHKLEVPTKTDPAKLDMILTVHPGWEFDPTVISPFDPKDNTSTGDNNAYELKEATMQVNNRPLVSILDKIQGRNYTNYGNNFFLHYSYQGYFVLSEADGYLPMPAQNTISIFLRNSINHTFRFMATIDWRQDGANCNDVFRFYVPQDTLAVSPGGSGSASLAIERLDNSNRPFYFGPGDSSEYKYYANVSNPIDVFKTFAVAAGKTPGDSGTYSFALKDGLPEGTVLKIYVQAGYDISTNHDESSFFWCPKFFYIKVGLPTGGDGGPRPIDCSHPMPPTGGSILLEDLQVHELRPPLSVGVEFVARPSGFQSHNPNSGLQYYWDTHYQGENVGPKLGQSPSPYVKLRADNKGTYGIYVQARDGCYGQVAGYDGTPSAYIVYDVK